jgi:phage major head subunit gpT-like protein
MIVTSDFLAGLMTNFRAIFQTSLAEFDKEIGLWKLIATIFPSVTDMESYNWLGEVPQMSEWKDERKVYGIGAYTYSLRNKHFEATIGVDRDTLEDDKYGMISPRVKSLARRAILFYNQQVFSQLDDGGTLKAYDGTAFFADSRTIGASANIDNNLAGDYGSTTDLVRTGMRLAVVAMRGFQDDRGVPMNLVPDTIVCSPTKEFIIREALLPAVAGTERPETAFFSAQRIIATPWIDAAVNYWYVLCTTAEVKPVILQNRKDPEFVAADDPKSDTVFDKRLFKYGVDSRFEVGYADPRTAIRIASSA